MPGATRGRLLFLVLMIPAVVSLCGSCRGPGTEKQENHPRPNAIIFLADDLGWMDVGYHGSEILTPNIDRLAREGVVLERYYTSPLCTPTRCRLMTGRYALRFGLATNVRPDGSLWVPRDAPLLAEVFHRAGYRTALIGKWHLGFRPGYRPWERGFDFFYGILGSWIDHFTQERKGQLDWYRNGQPVREEGFSADLLAREAVRWIREAKGEPFFLYVPFTVPHAPAQAPERWLQRYSSIRDPVRRAYAGMVSAMDEAIGRILSAVEAEGQGDRTVVFFAGDNGANEHQGGSNGELRGAKWTTYEGCLRVPAVWWWKARLRPRVVSDFVTNLDVYPTLLRAAGIEAPGEEGQGVPRLDGDDIWAILEGTREGPRRVLPFAFVGRRRVWGALYRPPWKVILHWEKSSGMAPAELYDVVQDPGEEHDRAHERAGQVKDMIAAFSSWWKDCTGKEFPRVNPVPRSGR